MSEEKGTDYFNIYGGVDHLHDCINDDFRMTTIYCADETEPRVVWAIGHELVSLYNGASILFNNNYRKVSIHELWHDDLSVEWFPPSSQQSLLGPPTYTSYRTESEIRTLRKSNTKLYLVYLATEHKDIYLILKYFNMDAGWVTYYKILEAIENLAKEKTIDLNINEAKRKSFTNTANNFSLSGLDSRHGFKESIKKNNTPTMTVEEGYKFIADIAINYLKAVFTQLENKDTSSSH